MAKKKTTSTKTTANKPGSGKAGAKSAATPAAEEANRAARAEFEAHRARSAAASEDVPSGQPHPGSIPHGHPEAHAVPRPGGHPIFGWSAPWGPPPGMPWPAFAPAAMHHPPGGESLTRSGSLLENIGTMLRLGTALINVGLQSGSQLAYGMGGMGAYGYNQPSALGHGHWSGHGCGSAPHGECCCSPCTPYADCCCAYGYQECRPGVHNCP